ITIPQIPKPVASIPAHALHVNEWSTVANWISYSDADNNPATQYQFWDGGTASGGPQFWTAATGYQPAQTYLTVSAANVGGVWVGGATAGGSETMDVRAFDGTDWSDWV